MFRLFKKKKDNGIYFKECKCCGRRELETPLGLQNGLCVYCRLEQGKFSKKKTELLNGLQALEFDWHSPNMVVLYKMLNLLNKYLNDKEIAYFISRIPKVYSEESYMDYCLKRKND